jgi:hypothetical protein
VNTFEDHFAEVPDNMDDTSKWKPCPCPTCGGNAEMRWTGLRTVASSGDENHAEKQWRPAPPPPPDFHAPSTGPFVVQEHVGLPGDRIMFAAIDPATGITPGAHREREHAEHDAHALNAAYAKGREDGSFDAAHVVEAARLVHAARQDDVCNDAPHSCHVDLNAAISLADALESYDRRPEFAAAPIDDMGPFTCSKCGNVVDELFTDSTECESCAKGEPGDELWE